MGASGAESTSPAYEGVAECKNSVLPEVSGSLPYGASSTAPDTLVTAHFSTSRALPGGAADEQELCLLSDSSELVVKPAAPRVAAAGETVSCRQLGQPGEAAAKDIEAAAEGTGDCGHEEARRAEAEQGAAPTGKGHCLGAAAREKLNMGGFRDRRTGVAVAAPVRHM